MTKTIFLFIFMILAMPYAQAAEGPWASADQMQARLISSIDSVGNEKTFDAAIEIRLSPGWHSYWRSPGDSGLAPTFHWGDSVNLDKAVVSFPPPKRFDELGLTTFGYSGDVMFPMTINMLETGKDISLKMRMDTMVCKDICIPQTLNLSLDIPAGDGVMASKNARMIDFAKSKIPATGENKSFKIENITIGPDAVVINAYSKTGFDRSDVFVEMGDFSLTTKPDFQVQGDDKKRKMIVVPIADVIKEEYGTTPIPYSGIDITVTLINGRDAVEQTLIIK